MSSLLGRDFCDSVLQTVGPGSFGLILEDAIGLSTELLHSGCRTLSITVDRLTFSKPHSFDTVIIDLGLFGSEDVNSDLFRRLHALTRRYLVLIGQLKQPVLQSRLDQAGFMPALRKTASCGTAYTVWEHKETAGFALYSPNAFVSSQHPYFLDFSLRFFRPDDCVLIITNNIIDAPSLEANFKASIISVDSQRVFNLESSHLNTFGAIAVCEINGDNLSSLSNYLFDYLRADGRLILNLANAPCKTLLDHLLSGHERRFFVETYSGGDTLHAPSVVLARNPLLPSLVPYSHPSFSKSTSAKSTFIDFASFYENPWLYRSMVQLGERLINRDLLRQLALYVSENAPTDSADIGAALCVLGYDFRDRRELDFEPFWRQAVSSYISQNSDNPHVIRWQISLQYLKGLFSLTRGYPSRALYDFKACLDMDPFSFSALLATKIVGAAFLAGTLSVSKKNMKSAEAFYRRGIMVARQALSKVDDNAIGNPEFPTEFGFQEIAEIADMAAQCTAALHSLPFFETNPGLFWSRINLKRFGLATWALELKRENDALRATLSTRTAD